MSRRRVLPPEDDEDELLDESDDWFAFEEDVEYFVDVLELWESVRTSVPKLLQLSQSCSSAPSTFVVVSDGFSAPHISHWGIASRRVCQGIKRTPCGRETGSEVAPRAPKSLECRRVADDGEEDEKETDERQSGDEFAGGGRREETDEAHKRQSVRASE